MYLSSKCWFLQQATGILRVDGAALDSDQYKFFWSYTTTCRGVVSCFKTV